MFRVFPGNASSAAALEVLFDAALGFLAVLAAASTIGVFPAGSLAAVIADPSALVAALGFALVMSLLQTFSGLYRHEQLALGSAALRIGAVVLVGGYATYLTLKQFGTGGHPGRLIGTAVVYFVAAFVVFRGIVAVCRQAIGRPRVLIVGTGSEARHVFENLNSQRHGAREVVGFYATGVGGLEEVAPSQSSRVFPRETQLTDIVRRHGIQEIIVASREQRGGVMPMEQLLTCRSRGVKVLDLAAFYERTHAEIPVDTLKASWLVYGDGFVQGPLRRAAKRTFDIVTSAALLALTAPIMLITAIAIKLDSPGPVLYRQERVGLGGRSFMCVKFRSMRTDAEKDGVARWASKNDSRVTRVGAFIRKTRIDELPQLISVLRGEMSMVGPRPERPSFVAQLAEHIPFYDLRHSVKPGVTGWAQVRFSYGASIDDARRKHQFDLYYVKNNSVLLDMVVLLETVAVVLFREGAQ